MTGRERLVAAARGGELDQKPIICWPVVGGESDAIVAKTIEEVISHAGDDRAVLLEVLNPFGLAAQDGIDLNALHVQDVEAGAEKLASYKAQVKSNIQRGLESGADGVFYVLKGARGSISSPMQYGGYYLEHDREILTEVEDARLNVIFVVGNDDVYIDFVSDLPAQLFAWDAEPSTFDSAYVRTLRNGAQASSDSGSEVTLVSSVTSIADALDKGVLHAV